MSDDELLNRIQIDGEQALKPLYINHKKAFLQFALRYTQDMDLSMDAYQEAIIAFYEYCLTGRFDPKKGSAKNMIFLMGRAYLINRMKREKKIFPDSAQIDSGILMQLKAQTENSLSDQEIKLKQAILKLGKPCQDLIELFYYYNYSVEVIKERLGYKNVNVVSSHKSRCVKQLKQIIQSE